VWTKAEEHVIEKEYCKENCIDRSVIEPIIIDFCDDDYLFYKLLGSFFVLFFHIILFWYQ
jgi:hypothetical protein